jgi:hypothetical protein
VAATVDVHTESREVDCRRDALELSIADNAYHVARGTYATEADLVAEGYLADVTDLHDVVLLDDAADYRIVATGVCTDARIALAQ